VNHGEAQGWNPDASLFVVDALDIAPVWQHVSTGPGDLLDSLDRIV